MRRSMQSSDAMTGGWRASAIKFLKMHIAWRPQSHCYLNGAHVPSLAQLCKRIPFNCTAAIAARIDGTH